MAIWTKCRFTGIPCINDIFVTLRYFYLPLSTQFNYAVATHYQMSKMRMFSRRRSA